VKNLKQYGYFILFFVLLFNFGTAQESVTQAPKKAVDIFAFLDIYYAYDFNQPEGEKRQDFLFNHNRHNEFNLNLGLLQFNLEREKYRAVLGLQTGSYAQDNYAAESEVMRFVNEAKVGISLNHRNNLWFDAGIMTSHIGWENAVSTKNLTLTRSLAAENSPYFLTGAKLTFTPDDQWLFLVTVCNGWQRIARLAGNSLPSFGTQISYSPNEKLTLNWSTLVGSEFPDENRKMRYFNNFYGKFQLGGNINLITGFDIGIQQESKNSSDYDYWFSPVVIFQYGISKKWKTALRYEYYGDEHQIMIASAAADGFKTHGASLNFDYLPTVNAVCRIEGRLLKSKDDIFIKGDGFTNSNFSIITSIAVKFNR
jgi:hypothetical protein